MWNIIMEYFPGWKIWCQALATMLIAIVVYFIHKRLFAWGNGKSLAEQQKNSEQKQQQLTGNYDADLLSIKQLIGKNGDVHFRDFRISI